MSEKFVQNLVLESLLRLSSVATIRKCESVSVVDS